MGWRAMARPEPEPPDVLLFNPPYAQRLGGGVVPPMGLAYVAGALRECDARVRIVDMAFEMQSNHSPDLSVVATRVHDVLTSLPEPPRLIGVGPLVTANLKSAIAILTACRDTGAVTVIGGPL